MNDGAARRGIVHPGGFVITDDAIQHCGFRPGSKVADIGCGTGATVHRLSTVYGAETIGIDIDSDLIATAKAEYQSCSFICADAADMTFDDSSMDGLIFECSLSKIGQSAELMQKCAKALKNGGYLIVSDLTARGKPAELSGMLGRIDRIETYTEAMSAAGFFIDTVKDYTDSLIELWGSMLLSVNESASCQALGIPASRLKDIKLAYTLIIARKENANDMPHR